MLWYVYFKDIINYLLVGAGCFSEYCVHMYDVPQLLRLLFTSQLVM